MLYDILQIVAHAQKNFIIHKHFCSVDNNEMTWNLTWDIISWWTLLLWGISPNKLKRAKKFVSCYTSPLSSKSSRILETYFISLVCQFWCVWHLTGTFEVCVRQLTNQMTFPRHVIIYHPIRDGGTDSNLRNERLIVFKPISCLKMPDQINLNIFPCVLSTLAPRTLTLQMLSNISFDKIPFYLFNVSFESFRSLTCIFPLSLWLDPTSLSLTTLINMNLSAFMRVA